MNKQKLSYTAPVAETFVVQAEGVICESAPLGALLMPNGIFTSPVEQGLLDEDYE